VRGGFQGNEDPQAVKELLDKWGAELYAVAELLSCFIPTAGEQVRTALETGLDRLEGPLFPRIAIKL